jgi:putative ABC transport system permease protein
MDMGSFDTSLFEASLILVKFLLLLALGSIVAGLFNLPMFLGVLKSSSLWFWSLEETRRASPTTARWKRFLAPIYLIGFPIVSVAATLICLGYFGGLDFGETAKADKISVQLQAKFENFTRDAGKEMAAANPVFNSLSEDSQEVQIRASAKIIRTMLILILLLIGPFPSCLLVVSQFFGRSLFSLMIRSLSRNFLRTVLTYLAVFVFTSMICGIYAVLSFLAKATSEKESNLKAIITEKNQIPSQMKPTHEKEFLKLLDEVGKRDPRVKLVNGDQDMMTWAFVGGTTDPANRSFQNSVFFFAMEPRKLLTMMDGLDELTGEQRQQLEEGVAGMTTNPRAVLMGKERLRTMGKQVGDRIRITSMNYKDVTFDFEIIGEFPEGRYDQSAVMNRDYLYRSLEEYEGRNAGKIHPLADKCLNLIWVRLPSREAFEAVAAEVNSSGNFVPAVKMETASSAVNSFLDPLKDQLFAMKWIITPTLFFAMCLVISNAISISVRERQKEMAVLKVLGFSPNMVLALILGEAILLGTLSGYLAVATIFDLVNSGGGIPFPIAFFPKFLVPQDVLILGPIMGALTAFLGSVLPAWSARTVKVSEVFARVS